ncbi:hypothetical protein SEA_WEASELS2_274 [Rhodococcus phage Weasels2]|uniref:Uncharacterized protein n=1 Tax=Rhodococcus phage Weasels2 TaxID=1897437 RepID=A0A1I9SAP6_9CAUD|nr:hypothetical protein FDH04_gp142 [Rhodococcus phage Weasels2]AOZ63852.1 hypothetical protein SEA_WEASELS2_274 [Rhodococcus phage Weasels2]
MAKIRIMVYSEATGTPARCIAEDSMDMLKLYLALKGRLLNAESGYRVVWHKIKDALTGYEYTSDCSFDLYLDGVKEETYQIEY